MDRSRFTPNSLRRPRTLIAVGLASLALGAASCGDDDPSTTPRATTSNIEQTTQYFLARLECYGRGNSFEDCDGDRIVNSQDVVAGRDDLGDDDGDFVLNRLDRWHGIDDKGIDSDNDGTPDYLDSFFGDNHADADGDGWTNQIDPQPFSAPAPTQPSEPKPPGLTNTELIDQLLLDQMRRKYTAELLGPKPDSDYDGTSDDIDSSPTVYTNDRDGDGDQDFYDPKPSDPYLDSRNDPYDPRNDEYWE